MKLYELKNDFLTVKFKDFGGEMISILKNDTGVEYLWNGDEKYWKRNAPILFPFVGSLKGGHYTYQNQEYAMGQHGFARDMVFKLKEKTENTIWFSLEADEETLKKYPFQFLLELGYVLTGSTVKVCWRVINEDDKTMYFSIGGHPAFMCPLDGQGSQTDYYLLFDTPRNIYYGTLNSDGLLANRHLELATQGGVLPIDAHLFDNDALIIEEGQTSTISLAGPDRKAYLTVKFDTPLVGIWSPAGKNAPFVCIEPWCGRCDGDNFSGGLCDRQYGNTLEPDQVFEKEYEIIVR